MVSFLFSEKILKDIDERKKRIPVGAVPIVRKKPFTPATGTNAKNVYSDIYNDDNSYQYQHQDIFLEVYQVD